jgi:FkbM family methyltransferase
VIRSSRTLFGTRPNAIYDVLAHLEPGLMLDVGAAAGMMTLMMLDRSPNSTVIAFEPFPGNHEYIDARLGSDERVTIIKAAVADTTEPVRFYISGTVQGHEPGWGHLVGYSSLGYIVDADHTGDGTTLTVPTVRVDDVVGSRHVRFMKVDVQGGELGVLQSASQCLAEDRMDVMFVEFGGDLGVLDHIIGSGFEVFDSEYLLIVKPDADLGAWDTFYESNLSTGARYLRGWPRTTPGEPADYCAMFREQQPRVGSVFTDLVCMRTGFVETYLKGARDAAS